MTKTEPASVPEEIKGRLKYWLLNFRIWRYLFWIFGPLGVCTSTLAAASKVSGDAAPYYAVVSAVCLAIIGFTNPQRRANAYMTAWRGLSAALLRYKTGLVDIAAVITAVEVGDETIGQADSLASSPREGKESEAPEEMKGG